MRSLLRRAAGALLLGIALSAATGASATMNRFWLASQQDFGNKRGFIVDLECEAPGNEPCKLSGLRMILGVGDNKSWRFPDVRPGWQLDHDYHVKAVIDPAGAKMWLDDKLVVDSPGSFVPDTGELSMNTVPDWAAGPAEYRIVQRDLTLTVAGSKPRAFTFATGTPIPAPLLLFETKVPSRRIAFRPPTDKAFTIELTFRISAQGDPHQYAPMIDRYGQARAAEWPGKARSDADLKASIATENARLKAWAARAGYDRFGGWKAAGWHEKATGYYHTARHSGKWWLISPEGNPFFYTGLCTAPALAWEKTPVTGREYLFAELPPKTGPTASAWGGDPWGSDPGTEYVAIRSANLARKFGSAWEKQETDLTARRIKSWGFSGMGKWCDPIAGMPSLPVLGSSGVPKVAGHPDVFDPAVQAAFRESLRAQIEPRRADPFILGWSLGNEYDEIIKRTEIQDIMKRPANLPLKRALIDYGLMTLYRGDIAKLTGAWQVEARAVDALYATQPLPPAEDIESLRRFYATAYYQFIYRTVKSIDPHHLYFGFWIVPGWWEDEADWGLIAPHCDVIGYDNYSPTFADERLTRLIKQTNKPVLCGEFSYPPFYGGHRGFGMYSVWSDDDAAAGDAYTRWMAPASTNPYCVGGFWFQYRDEPLTGRGPGHGEGLVYGEHYAFGLVDETDRPKWDLVERVRKANLTVDARRMK